MIIILRWLIFCWCVIIQGAILTTMLVSRNFNSKNFASKKSDGSQVKESTDSSATMDEEDTKGNVHNDYSTNTAFTHSAWFALSPSLKKWVEQWIWNHIDESNLINLIYFKKLFHFRCCASVCCCCCSCCCCTISLLCNRRTIYW